MQRLVAMQKSQYEYKDTKPQSSQMCSYLSSPHFSKSMIKSDSTSSFAGMEPSPVRISIKEKNWLDKHNPEITGKFGVRIESPNKKFVSRQYSENHTLGTINSEESVVNFCPPKPNLN